MTSSASKVLMVDDTSHLLIAQLLCICVTHMQVNHCSCQNSAFDLIFGWQETVQMRHTQSATF